LTNLIAMPTIRCLLMLCAFLLPASLAAQKETAPKEAAQKDAKDSTTAKPSAEKAEQWVTRHTVTIGGKAVSYVATAGTLIIRDSSDTPVASFGYVAYTKPDVKDPATRPLTFAYNGGPGSSSIWLHMGALGPRRVMATDAGPTPPPPYRLVDNEHSLIDRTDLVMIDPVGTGISRALGKKQNKDFWGVDPDIESISRFIKQFVTENNRWNSPKFLLGESYGTTRSAGIVDYLQTRENMAFNGVVLVSVALDIEAIFEWPGNDRPYALFVPTFAATSFFHHALPAAPADLNGFLQEVRAWSLGPYTNALMEGNGLSDAERDTIAAKLHQYTGLSVDYIKKANLRVTEGEYTQELLREHRETVGRLDSRFTGVTFDPLAQNAAYDPQSAAVSGAYTSAFLDYYHRELNVPRDRNYVISARAFESWDWKHRVPGESQPIPMVNTGPDLSHALSFNPNLRVLVLNGVYDLATPFLATEYMVSHLNIAPELRSHVIMKYYDAGHMMYLHEPSLVRMKSDVGAFIDATGRAAQPGDVAKTATGR
jgi:carboxypeptidase C (cathepsin A)